MHPKERVLPVDEDEVVRDLLKISPEFNNFYENENDKTGDVHWMVNKDLPREINATMFKGKISDEIVPCIYIRRCPAVLEDAKTIAHELGHAIRYEEKSAVEIESEDDKFTFLAAKLASLVEDPIIDGILRDKYDFNLMLEYKKVLKSAQKELRNRDYVHLSYIQKIDSIINLSGIILEWDLIEDKDALRKYQTKFEKRYPQLLGMNADLISIVRETGTNTLEDRKRVCNRIIDKFELRDMFHVV
jgi:hypothetical protein